jgi:pyruvate dehydrogenase E1 component alpha subunit
MHLIDVENGVLGSAPIVGGTISLALGSALSSSIRRDKRVTVSFFGDGATGEGVLFESLNFAALKKLPIIFACENNMYSTHMPIDEIRINQDIYKSAEPFGIRSYKVDGNDVIDVYQTALNAADDCRNGKGPIFIEFKTYRFRGHVGPDDNIQGSHTDIRPSNEIESWTKKDPILILKEYIINHGILSHQELENIQQDILREVETAHKLAEKSPTPNAEDIDKYVYH